MQAAILIGASCDVEASAPIPLPLGIYLMEVTGLSDSIYLLDGYLPVVNGMQYDCKGTIQVLRNKKGSERDCISISATRIKQ